MISHCTAHQDGVKPHAYIVFVFVFATLLGCHTRYSSLWRRSGDHEVLVLRPTVPMTLLRWRGVVKAGTDIDKV